jgi:hypothetical protein
MNKRYKIEGTYLLCKLSEILFEVNLKTIAQFLKQNSAQLNTDWRVATPSLVRLWTEILTGKKAFEYNVTVTIIITFSPPPINISLSH